MTINDNEIYEPNDDSKLLLDSANKLIRKQEQKELTILEMGIGSGYISENLIKKQNPIIKLITGIDINKKSIDFCKKNNINNKKIKLIQSNLFNKLKKKDKFDIIIFNPPYLPNEKKIKVNDLSLYGGKKGYEITHEFIKELNSHLNKDGYCLLLLCNLSKPKTSLELLNDLGLEYELVDSTKAFPEELFIYKITKNQLLKEINQMGYSNLQKYAKGKKGVIYTVEKDKKIFKIKSPIDKNSMTIRNEIYILKKLKQLNFVPQLIEEDSKEDYFIQEFIDAKLIGEWIEEKRTKKDIQTVFTKILKACKKLDEMKIDKKEMTNPYKHILIDKKNNIFFIDFERSKMNPHPQNITQVINYFTSDKINKILEKLNINIDKNKVNELSKEYKKDYSNKCYKEIENYILNK